MGIFNLPLDLAILQGHAVAEKVEHYYGHGAVHVHYPLNEVAR